MPNCFIIVGTNSSFIFHISCPNCENAFLFAADLVWPILSPHLGVGCLCKFSLLSSKCFCSQYFSLLLCWGWVKGYIWRSVFVPPPIQSTSIEWKSTLRNSLMSIAVFFYILGSLIITVFLLVCYLIIFSPFPRWAICLSCQFTVSRSLLMLLPFRAIRCSIAESIILHDTSSSSVIYGWNSFWMFLSPSCTCFCSQCWASWERGTNQIFRETSPWSFVTFGWSGSG